MFVRKVLAPLELLEQADPTGGGKAVAAPGDTGSITFTPEQQAAIGRMISDERKKAEDKAKSEFEQKQRDLQAQADQEAREREAKAKGDYETLEADLKAQLAKAKDEAKGLRDQLTRYQEAIATAIEPAQKNIPEEVMGLYSGPEDDPLTRWEFLHKPATQELVKKLQGDGTPGPGNERGPQTSTTPGQLTEAQELAIQRQRRSSF